jgi:hypothetical protein
MNPRVENLAKYSSDAKVYEWSPVQELTLAYLLPEQACGVVQRKRGARAVDLSTIKEPIVHFLREDRCVFIVH